MPEASEARFYIPNKEDLATCPTSCRSETIPNLIWNIEVCFTSLGHLFQAHGLHFLLSVCPIKSREIIRFKVQLDHLNLKKHTHVY